MAVRGGLVDVTEIGSRLNVTNLTMQGGTMLGGPIYIYGSTVHTDPAATTALIDGFLDLSQTGGATFDVADGAAAIDLDLPSAFNATITKTGPARSMFTTKVCHLATILSTGRSSLDNLHRVSELMKLRSTVGYFRRKSRLFCRNAIQINGTATFDGPNDVITSAVRSTGPGGFVKRGTSTVTFSGQSYVNTYTGTTTVNEGTLVLQQDDSTPECRNCR